ncbi:MAG: 4-diphosphocytidyl-2C-methyl-D-erythritol kinase [Paracoccaceae bacterium]|nr:MAG: 4-diphosphocytidyl-2C-methyl-D-erythritol kinase [Paracoccaceae bacterium]
MRFGPVPLSEAEGAVLAHSIPLPGGRLRKGRVLGPQDIAALSRGRDRAGDGGAAGARRPDRGRGRPARRLRAGRGWRGAGADPAGALHRAGNLLADRPGILRVDAAAVDRLNAVDERVTLATLPDFARVGPRDLVATVKILPFGLPEAVVAAAISALGGAAVVRVHGRVRADAAVIQTRVPGMRETLIAKGFAALRDRLAALGMAVAAERVVPHETAALAAALAELPGEMILILGASAAQDRADVAPAAVVAAGGRIERFGMPVDPGNLLFLGALGERPVVGLPGSVRSPALNGADRVLERLACGLPVSAADIAAMGVGGLLKEIPTRPQPRTAPPAQPGRPRIAAIVLAAGSARRMRGADKLLEEVEGAPLIARIARACLGAGLAAVHVVLPAGDRARRAALAGLDLDIVDNPLAAEGMASSIRAGMAAIDPETDAVILVLADMPEIGAAHLRRLVAAYDPAGGARSAARSPPAAGRGIRCCSAGASSRRCADLPGTWGRERSSAPPRAMWWTCPPRARGRRPISTPPRPGPSGAPAGMPPRPGAEPGPPRRDAPPRLTRAACRAVARPTRVAPGRR